MDVPYRSLDLFNILIEETRRKRLHYAGASSLEHARNMTHLMQNIHYTRKYDKIARASQGC